MEASKDKYKLKFSGCCKLTDDQLSKVYNLDLLSDEELASVNLERKSLTDDYRHLHELSMARQQEQERIKKLELQVEIDKELELQRQSEIDKELVLQRQSEIDKELVLQRQSVLKSLTIPESSNQMMITPEPVRILEVLGVGLRASLPVPDNDSTKLYSHVELVDYESDEHDSDFIYLEEDRANEAQRMPNAFNIRNFF